MSKIGCVCGNVIRDQTDRLSYKASLLQDIHTDDYWDWLGKEIESYAEAVAKNGMREWLTERGASIESLNEINHASFLQRRLASRYFRLTKSVFECEVCGRLLVEERGNQFLPFSPDSGKFNGILAMEEK